MMSLGTLGGDQSIGVHLNDRTEVVGEADIRPGSDASRAFLWTEKHGMRNLGGLGGKFAGANSMNNRGEVVGFAQLPNGEFRAFLWVRGQGMKSLGTLGGANSRAPLWIRRVLVRAQEGQLKAPHRISR